MYVQYGCGHCAPLEWVNFDASPTLVWERLPVLGRLYHKNARRFPANVRYGDIVAGLPVPDGSCDGVYASKVLEHLARDDCHRALEHTLAMLRSGGIFRVLVPDMSIAARVYLEHVAAGDPAANELFLEWTCLGQTQRERGLAKFVHEWLRTSAHRWMWDVPSLTHALEAHGFAEVRPCVCGDCRDPMFRLVEDEGRFAHAVALEAVRP